MRQDSDLIQMLSRRTKFQLSPAFTKTYFLFKQRLPTSAEQGCQPLPRQSPGQFGAVRCRAVGASARAADAVARRRARGLCARGRGGLEGPGGSARGFAGGGGGRGGASAQVVSAQPELVEYCCQGGE